jgi:hypothetical protein
MRVKRAGKKKQRLEKNQDLALLNLIKEFKIVYPKMSTTSQKEKLSIHPTLLKDSSFFIWTRATLTLRIVANKTAFSTKINPSLFCKIKETVGKKMFL